jgi:hypothetical protein
MRKHVRILGWLQVFMGLFDLLIGLAAFGLLSGIGILSGDITAFGALSVLGGVIGTLAIVLALPNLIVGIGLLRNWGGWVLILAVILGLFNLAKFPWGTAIALYTFWIAWKLSAADEL